MTLLQRLDDPTGPLPEGAGGPGPGRVRTTFPMVLDRAARRRLGVQVRALVALPPLPHVAPVLDGGVDSAGRPWIERPGPDGPTLADRVAAGVLDGKEALVLLLPAVTGLAALHDLGVVHGGVGPAAVVLAGAGPVLVDPRPPLVAERAGPPEPSLAGAEVLRGEAPGPPADVAAVAATLVHLVTGRSPWGRTEDGAESVLLRMLSGAPPDLGGLAAWPRVAAAVTRSLAVRPDDRPTAVALAAALADPDDEGDDDDRVDTLGPAGPATAAASLNGRPVGSRYLLHDRLGRGAMGEVYRATARHGGPEVAVKVLRAELAEDTTLVTRFLAERSTLTGIEHPNLVRVHDLVAEGGMLAIVMDLVDGPDLRRYLRTAPPIPPAAACRLLAQLAGALAAVHGAGVVHRDLKPENVLLERTGSEDVRVRLADFGVARSSSRVTLTRMDGLIGTPEYLAPELVAGATAGPPADIYAVGIVAYELVVGCRPFEADHPAALLKAHAELEPPRPPGIEDALWSVIAGCLAKDPAARPTAGALAATLAERAEALEGAPAQARLASPPPALAAPGAGPPATVASTVAPGAGRGATAAGTIRPGAGPAAPAGAAVGAAPPPGALVEPACPSAGDLSDDDHLGTVVGTLPPSRPQPPPATAGRRRHLVTAGAAAVLVAALAGAVFAASGRDQGGTAPPTSRPAVAAVRSVPLVTHGERADPRTVNLRFEPLDGAGEYVVVRDPGAGDVPLDTRPLAGASFVTVVDEANDKEHCYVVMAILRDDRSGTTTTPGPAILEPYCTT